MGVDDETQQIYQSQRQPAIWGGKEFKEAAYSKALFLNSEISHKGINAPIDMNKVILLVAKQTDCAETDITTAK